MFTRGELVLGILYVLAEVAWLFVEKGTTSHWHATVVPATERQAGVSLFGLLKALVGIGEARSKEEEEDEEHGEERGQHPEDVEKKAEKTKKKLFKSKSKTTKKAGKTKKRKSDSDHPQVAKLEDKVD